MRRLLLLILTFLTVTTTQARLVSCTSNGNWSATSTWSQVPTCGDTITIPFGRTVTVNTQHTYLCATPIKVIVSGTLEFVNGYKLGLPCGSQVEILVGGVLKKSTAGGGNSTLIDICGSTVWNAGDGPISGYALLQAGGSLPVSWLYLDATRKENHVQLNWSTASEVNNDFFTVERSTDQYHFTALTKIDGAGNSSLLNNYSYEDHTAPAGLVYYRIRQTDFDGRFSLSKMVAVSGRNSGSFELIAVAALDGSNLSIIFTEPRMPHCNFKICDVGGRVIDMGALEAGEGIISRNISAPTLVRGGIYLLQLSNGEEAVAKRFIVN